MCLSFFIAYNGNQLVSTLCLGKIPALIAWLNILQLGFNPNLQEAHFIIPNIVLFMAQTGTNVLDWQTGLADIPSQEAFSALQTRTLVVCGSNSDLAMRRCNQLLVDRLPQAQLRVLDGANHFMIGTHAAELQDWIRQHRPCSR